MIDVTIKKNVARVVINRPDRLNAIDASGEQELEALWQDLEQRKDVRCIVLTGAGEKAFCVGADMKDVSASGLEYWAMPRPNGFGGIAFRSTLNIPIIGRINGYALGGGFEMALGCDILIASEKAKFGLPEPRVGRMALDGGMVLLQRKIPHNLAMGVLLSGRHFSAEQMVTYGIVNEVCASTHLDGAVEKWVEDILACAPLSLRAVKQTVSQTAHLSPREAQALKLPEVIRALQSEDADEGVAAFQEKRPPVWRGR